MFWITIMFLFGFYRQWNAKITYGNILTTSRIILSITNGALYVAPPIGFMRIVFLLNRIEIKYFNIYKNTYRFNYYELIGYNYDIL